MVYHFLAVPGVAVFGVRSVGPGYLMVDLFFILSGFVMARTYGPAFASGFSWSRYRRFLEARFARVYPLYALICVCIFLLTKMHVITSASFPVRALLSNMPMLENLGAGLLAPGLAEYLDPPSWSISTELGAYLLFPLLSLVALHRSRAAAVGTLLVCAVTVLWLSVMPHSWRHLPFRNDPLNISSGETLWPLARCLAEFALGLLTFRAAAGLDGRRRGGRTDFLLLVALGLAWILPEGDVVVVGLLPLLILQVCEDDTKLARCLASAVPYRLGEWSYAIYLLHWPALDLLVPIEAFLHRLRIAHQHEAALAFVAVAVIVTAAAVHSLVEKPARRFLRNLFQEPVRPIQTEPGAP